MRLGLHSSEFGSISIATSASSGTLQASITLDHSALGHAISTHLPAIEEKLGITARVDVREAGAAPNQGGNPQSSPQQGGSRHRAWSPAHSISPVGIDPPPAVAAPTLRNPTARLSVLA